MHNECKKNTELILKSSGRLTFLNEEPTRFMSGQKKKYIKCICKCGKETILMLDSYQRGKTLSCGCLHKEKFGYANRTHGKSYERIYSIFKKMHDRCKNPNNSSYKDYGGRGIKVCEEWNIFETFVEDNKILDTTTNLTLERVDVNGNYCKENISWVPKSEQAKNTRRTIWVDECNTKICLMDYCRKHNLPYNRIHRRIAIGWPIDKAVSQPFNSHLKQKTFLYNSEIWTLVGLSKHLNIDYFLLYSRIKKGFSIEEAINKPKKRELKKTLLETIQ